jgi:hypothetical protein
MLINQIQTILRRLLADPGPKGSSTPRVSGAAPATVIGESPVTLSLSQLDDMRAQIRQGHARVAELEAQLAGMKGVDPAGRVMALNGLARVMLTIVRFAIANLPPSEIPKWPRDAVAAMAVGLRYLPDFNVDDEVLLAELRLFMAEIEEHEIDRARKREDLIASAPTTVPGRRKTHVRRDPDLVDED